MIIYKLFLIIKIEKIIFDYKNFYPYIRIINQTIHNLKMIYIYENYKNYIINYYKLLLYIKIILFQCLSVVGVPIGVCVSVCGLALVGDSTVETPFQMAF